MTVYATWTAECEGWAGSDLDAHTLYEHIGGFDNERDFVAYLRGAGHAVSRYQGGYRVRCRKHRQARPTGWDKLGRDVAEDHEIRHLDDVEARTAGMPVYWRLAMRNAGASYAEILDMSECTCLTVRGKTDHAPGQAWRRMMHASNCQIGVADRVVATRE